MSPALRQDLSCTACGAVVARAGFPKLGAAERTLIGGAVSLLGVGTDTVSALLSGAGLSAAVELRCITCDGAADAA